MDINKSWDYPFKVAMSHYGEAVKKPIYFLYSSIKQKRLFGIIVFERVIIAARYESKSLGVFVKYNKFSKTLKIKGILYISNPDSYYKFPIYMMGGFSKKFKIKKDDDSERLIEEFLIEGIQKYIQN